VRRNGFVRPFHPLQLLSWFVFGADALVYCIFSLPLIEAGTARAAVAAIYAATVIAVVFATVEATRCDPSDPHLRLQDSSELKSQDDEGMRFCGICDVIVFPRSKHCGACDKCVHVFDHHCMWLNNCIGDSNYYSFFATVSAVAAMLSVVLGSCVYLFVDYIANEDVFELRVHRTFSEAFPKEVILGLLVGLCIVNGPLLLLDAQLVALHIFLSSQGLTTYEYIMSKTSMNEEDLQDSVTASTKDEQPTPASGRSQSKAKRRIKTLPQCMDWIVFVRCGKRRRRRGKSKTAIERFDALEEPNATEDSKSGDPSKSPRGPAPRSQQEGNEAPLHPSPPGSTHDVESNAGDRLEGPDAEEATGMTPATSCCSTAAPVAAKLGRSGDDGPSGDTAGIANAQV